MEDVSFESLSKLSSVSACFTLAVLYVGSLYVYSSDLPRDHPRTIKERVVRVSFACTLSIILLHLISDSSQEKSVTLWRWMGIHTDNITQAATIPLLLFMILFFGPLCLWYLEDGVLDIQLKQLKVYVHDLRWWRNYFVAPVSEELVFRGCMLPMLVPAFGATASIILAPSFFGVAHIHHAWEKYHREKYPLKNVIISSLFQASYTTLFGALSSWLFLRTGHLTSAVICHSFCNMMGFPDFSAALSHERRIWICAAFISGLASFFILAKPMTAPTIYGNLQYATALNSQ